MSLNVKIMQKYLSLAKSETVFVISRENWSRNDIWCENRIFPCFDVGRCGPRYSTRQKLLPVCGSHQTTPQISPILSSRRFHTYWDTGHHTKFVEVGIGGQRAGEIHFIHFRISLMVKTMQTMSTGLLFYFF